jgi:hypothetical protein
MLLFVLGKLLQYLMEASWLILESAGTDSAPGAWIGLSDFDDIVYNLIFFEELGSKGELKM